MEQNINFEKLGKMYFEFLTARGIEIEIGEHGFATYCIFGEECCLQDVYTELEKRKTGEGSKLVDLISSKAKKLKCKFISSLCDLKARGASESMVAQAKYGFKPVVANNNILTFIKEL